MSIMNTMSGLAFFALAAIVIFFAFEDAIVPEPEIDFQTISDENKAPEPAITVKTVELQSREIINMELGKGSSRQLEILTLKIINNKENLKSYAFIGADIVFADETSINMLNGSLQEDSFPMDKCLDTKDEDFKGVFTIRANSFKLLNLCFPEITGESPELKLTFLEDAKVQKIGSKGNFFNQSINRSGIESSFSLPV